MSGGLVKACVPGKYCSVPEKIEFLIDSDTDLSKVNTEDEMHTDLSTWTPAERKKLQHMTEFHEECQCVFSEKGFHLYHNEMKNIPYESTHS